MAKTKVQTVDYYSTEWDKKNKSKYTQEVNEKIKEMTDLSNKNLKASQSLIDKSTNSAVSQVNEQKAALPQQYQQYFDTNAVQNLINQRQLEERMANLGLTDSGLNRTQMTALAIQKQNTDAAYNQKKQQAINTLDNRISQIIEEGKLKKDELAINAQSQLDTNIYNYRTSAQNKYETDRSNYAIEMNKRDVDNYNAEIEAEAAKEAARIKAAKGTIPKVKLSEDQISDAIDAYDKGESAYDSYIYRLSIITGVDGKILNEILAPLIASENIPVDSETQLQQQIEHYVENKGIPYAVGYLPGIPTYTSYADEYNNKGTTVNNNTKYKKNNFRVDRLK